MKYMNRGYFPYRCQAKEGSGIGSKGAYEYALLDMNSMTNNKLRIIYSETANPGQKSVEVDVSVKEAGRSVRFTFNDKEFVSNGYGFDTAFNEELDIKQEGFTSFYSAEATLDEVIALEMAV